MPAPVLSRDDIAFLLYEWLDITSLTTRDRFCQHSRETFDAVLELSAEVATTHFRSHNRAADIDEPQIGPDGRVETLGAITRALAVYAELGFTAAQFDGNLGGLQLPSTVAQASMAWFQAANAATSSYPLLTIANAHLLVAHGSAEQIDTWVRPMIEGRYFGTMCLSEPDAGSALADMVTRAERQPDGSYRLTGTKMWISGCDHEISENIVHLVLAKTPSGRGGVNSISLFVVPKYLADGSRNDVALIGLNHKMGMRGTANGLLAFGDGTFRPGGQPGAVGYLVGEEHRGLLYMFHMMNEARIGVGMMASALGYTAHLQSVEYARTRTQGRLPDAKDPASKPVALIEHPDVRRMLLAQKSYVEGGLALGLYCARLLDDQATAPDAASRDTAGLLLDVLTPIAKSWPSQWGLAANDLAIQIHGGYGYARDYDVEQFYRDNRLNQIHEGTHGIQGMDLLGRKVVMNDGAGLRLLADTIAAAADAAIAGDPELAEAAAAVRKAVQRLVDVTAILWSADTKLETLANSSIYLEATGHVVLAWIWLELLVACAGKEGAFYQGKRQAGRYFLRYELPKTEPQFDLLASLDRTILDTRPDWL